MNRKIRSACAGAVALLGLMASAPQALAQALRPARIALRRANPDTGGVRVDPDRIEDRLGVCVAHPDRRGTGVRRVVGAGRARLVHLREPQPVGYSRRVRRAADRNRDRPRRREPDLPYHRAQHRAKMGHTIMIAKSVGWVERLAKPITTSRTAMGIAEFIIGRAFARPVDSTHPTKW